MHIDYGSATPAQLHAHWEQYGPTFPVLAGCSMLYTDYADSYIPYNIVIDPDGVLRYSRQGFYEQQLHDAILLHLPAPDPVGDLSIQATGGGQLRLDWTPVEGAGDYVVYGAPEPYGPFDEIDAVVAGPPALLPLAAERRSYQVRARRPAGGGN